MRAMVYAGPGHPLALRELPVPEPAPGQILVRVHTCGVCRTDLHLVDGDLLDAAPHVVPGHEIVGEVAKLGADIHAPAVGTRVGIPWLGFTCGHCGYCISERENLCDSARFTGYQLNGGYAEYVVADARYAFPLPGAYDDLHAAPLLCAGLIGYRAYAMAGDAATVGLYGFGAAAHLIAQVALAQQRTVYAFTRPGDRAGQDFARSLGVHWAGDSNATPPRPLDAAILFAPAGQLVPLALAATVRGGNVICAGIHMTDIPSFPYHLLWGERGLQSVANLTRRDGEAFLTVAAATPLVVHVEGFPLEQANAALDKLRRGEVDGAAVLTIGS